MSAPTKPAAEQRGDAPAQSLPVAPAARRRVAVIDDGAATIALTLAAAIGAGVAVRSLVPGSDGRFVILVVLLVLVIAAAGGALLYVKTVGAHDDRER